MSSPYIFDEANGESNDECNLTWPPGRQLKVKISTMEVIPDNPLITVTAVSVKKVREQCGIEDVKRIKDSINIIEDWLKMQPHLAHAAKYISQAMLERVFIIAKGSVEGTKNRLEKLLTCRGMMPELSLHRSMEEFDTLCDVVRYVPLPKLHPDEYSRVMVTQFVTDKLDPFSLLSYFRYSFMIGEYRINFDYSASERYIIDMKNIHVGLLSKINPVVVKKAEVLCTEGFGTKIKGIHILNAPSFVDKLVFILKQALREKVASRVHVHSSFEDLHKHIPKEVLPKEYGGDEQSVASLSDHWLKMLRGEEASRLIRDSDHLISDESKRQTAKFNEEYMGMPGSFRTLTVD